MKMASRGFARIAVVLLTSAGLAALAAQPAAAAGIPRAHDRGFFLRLSAGPGTANSHIDYIGADENGQPVPIHLELSGTSGDINFAIGGIVSPNLAVHGTLFGWSVNEPNVEANGMDQGSASNLTLSVVGGGGGVTYYLEPSNLYLSGSLGLARLHGETPGRDFDSDLGPVLDMTIGKEWWVGGQWGLGAALAVNIHSLHDPDVDENWSGTSLALRFSATLN